ncbi:hypothetical protein ABTM48_19905, partial [Acinetobacter baumannii]
LNLSPFGINGLVTDPIIAEGGATVNGNIVVSAVAGPNGLTASLSTNNGLAKVPSTITVPSGSASADFPISTSPVVKEQTVLITASNGTSF